MMISTFKVDIGDIAPELTSRPVGAGARRQLLALLEEHESIDIDFHFKSLTPSFADECVGQLAAFIGMKDFRERVKLSNLSDAAKPLMKHVILTRCSAAR
ncbi:STAS-like domain-containing protein [Herbaspirillum sp. SJZ107]|uniref:STAS-like domain-containing protein n=1 Tax=Herbaspirillum sp. SJZ107 TaxID=2572881 RepID=UPI00114FEC7C|nr:STAS-like domain-containing protein [Herbaspirillum sp. SJZ107]